MASRSTEIRIQIGKYLEKEGYAYSSQTFKAGIAPELSSYISLEFHGFQKHHLFIKYAFGHRTAVDFSYSFYKEFGPPILRDPTVNFQIPPYNAKFDLGRLAGWQLPAYIDLSGRSVESTVQLFTETFEVHLRHHLMEVDGLEAYANLLSSNPDWLPWFTSNGPARAGEFAYVACSLGVPTQEIEARLEPYHRMEIQPQLERTKLDAPTYISMLLERLATVLA